MKVGSVAGKLSSTKKTATVTLRPTTNVTAAVSWGHYVTKITPSKKSMTLKAGSKAKLRYKLSPSNATITKVTFTSSNKKWATVSSKGTITAKKAGRGHKVKITIAAKDGSKKKAVVTVTIK